MRPAQLRPVKNKNNNYKYIVLNIVAILVDDRVQIMTITTRTLANLTANKNTYNEGASVIKCTYRNKQQLSTPPRRERHTQHSGRYSFNVLI